MTNSARRSRLFASAIPYLPAERMESLDAGRFRGWAMVHKIGGQWVIRTPIDAGESFALLLHLPCADGGCLRDGVGKVYGVSATQLRSAAQSKDMGPAYGLVDSHAVGRQKAGLLCFLCLARQHQTAKLVRSKEGRPMNDKRRRRRRQLPLSLPWLR